MPRYIIKLDKGDKSWYLEWSTVVDAPVTYGMSLEEFKEYYSSHYGSEGLASLPERLARVETNGTSAHGYSSVDEILSANKAGEKEKSITKAEIIEIYCEKKDDKSEEAIKQ